MSGRVGFHSPRAWSQIGYWAARTAATMCIIAIGQGCSSGKEMMPDDDPPIDEPPTAVPYACPDLDAAADTLAGCVVDSSGAPVIGATVTRDLLSATTDERGVFKFSASMLPGNALLEIAADGFRREQVAHQFPEQASLPPIVLIAAAEGRSRFLFGGDVSFGRRFLDSDDSTPRGLLPPDDETAMIRMSDPLPGSLAAVSFIKPYYQDADLGVVNLESPITTDPSTPHLTKDYAYFSLPETLDALIDLGVGYVSLGNNHIYDYLDSGLDDTLAFLDGLGLPHSGAGATVDAAFAPRALEVGANTYSMVSMTSIAGAEHDTLYVASESQGGAADLRDLDRVSEELANQAAQGRIPIAQLHMGFEYTFEPAESNVDRMKTAIDSGAALAIAHHTHVAQGFGMYEGTLLAHCLGNLVFDQDRLETMLGVMLRVDMDGSDLAVARAIPVYLEDYRPRPITGDLAARFLRRLGEFSHGHGASVIPHLGQGWIVPDSQLIDVERREVELDIEIPSAGWTVIDLRQIARADESLERIRAEGVSVILRGGRDLMMHGDFEDWDVDGEVGEAARWDVGTSASICGEAMRGRSGLCAQRSAEDVSPGESMFRNRIRVMGESLGAPNKEVTVVAYGSGTNAGAVFGDIVFAASVGLAEFGTAPLPLFAPGSYDWAMVAVDVEMPEDDWELDPRDPMVHPRALRLLVRHEAPESGSGELRLDDFAVINWEGVIGDTLQPVPNARDFVRVQGRPGPVTITITLARQRPSLP